LASAAFATSPILVATGTGGQSESRGDGQAVPLFKPWTDLIRVVAGKRSRTRSRFGQALISALSFRLKHGDGRDRMASVVCSIMDGCKARFVVAGGVRLSL